jgi:hypothetical protein
MHSGVAPSSKAAIARAHDEPVGVFVLIDRRHRVVPQTKRVARFMRDTFGYVAWNRLIRPDERDVAAVGVGEAFFTPAVLHRDASAAVPQAVAADHDPHTVDLRRPHRRHIHIERRELLGCAFPDLLNVGQLLVAPGAAVAVGVIRGGGWHADSAEFPPSAPVVDRSVAVEVEINFA